MTKEKNVCSSSHKEKEIKEKTEKDRETLLSKISRLERELNLSESRESRLTLQLRAATETKVLVNGLDPSDLWTAATLVKSYNCTTSTFATIASRWALGLPIDIETLRDVGAISRAESENTNLYQPSIDRERRRARARDVGRRELARYILPLVESLSFEIQRIESTCNSTGDPIEVLGKVYDRSRRFTTALAALQDMLLAEFPTGEEGEQ